MSDLNEIQFSQHIFKNVQISNFVKIRSVGAELFHADGRTDRQTDMTKLIVTFRIFANTLTNGNTLNPTKRDFPFPFFHGKMKFTRVPSIFGN